MTPQDIESRMAVAERDIEDLQKDVTNLEAAPQSIALLAADQASLRADFKEMRAEKTASKTTTAALYIAAIGAFATIVAAGLTLLGTTL